LVATPEQSPLERFCAVLADHGVEFIVVDGQAEALMGSARVTYDVDLCYRRTSENLERLATALASDTSADQKIESHSSTSKPSSACASRKACADLLRPVGRSKP